MTIQGKFFDIPVQGVSCHYRTMAELMDCYSTCMEKRDYEATRAVLEYGVDCSSLAATLELARLLKNTPQLNMPQQERLARSEKLLRGILNTLELPDRIMATSAAEMASLCEIQNRPVGCLGWLLTARRYGQQVPQDKLDWCRKKFRNLDINSLSDNVQDCYTLGYELWLTGEFRFAEMFLREATSASNRELAGRSYYALADLYREHRLESGFFEREAAICSRLADENGYAQYLTLKKGNEIRKAH